MTVIEEKGPVFGIGLWLGVLVVFLLFISGFWWYQIKSPGPISTVAPQQAIPEKRFTLKASFSNLKPLEKGHFELWAEFGEGPVSLGKFNFDSKGNLVDLEGKEIAYGEFQSKTDLSQAIQILVSIEPEEDRDASPSGILLLAGKLDKDRANLSFQAVDLTEAGGQYFLGTPSYSQDFDLRSGVWFAKPAGREFKEQEASLNLPPAPKGFLYEGWVRHKGQFLSIGRFSDPVGDDDFSGYSGLRRYPDFPGEDFLINEPEGLDFSFPLDLGDGESKVIISLEPDLEGEDPTGEGPFQLQFLQGDIPKEGETYTLYDLTLDLSSFPSGTVELL